MNYTGQKQFKIIAVAGGLAVDIGGTLAGSMVMGFVYGLYLFAQGVNPAEMSTAISSSMTILLMGLLLGLFFTMLGGYVAAYIARNMELLHGGVMGVLSLLVSIMFMVMIPDPSPVWYKIMASALVVPAALLGAFFRMATAGPGTPPPGPYPPYFQQPPFPPEGPPPPQPPPGHPAPPLWKGN